MLHTFSLLVSGLLFFGNNLHNAAGRRGGDNEPWHCIKWKLKKRSDKKRMQCTARTRRPKNKNKEKGKKLGKAKKKRNTKRIIFIINDYGLTLSGIGLQQPVVVVGGLVGWRVGGGVIMTCSGHWCELKTE